MKMRLFIAGFLFLAAAGLSAGERGGPGAAPAAFVTVGHVTEAPNVETKRYTGHVASSSSVNLVARVSGELLKLGFKEGDYVQKGQVLFELDPIRYEAEVKNIEAKIAENKARLVYAELSHKRSVELFQQKAASKDSMDSTESEYNAVKAALMASEAQLVTTKDDLENTRIIAPINGKIGVAQYTEGNYLTPNSGTIATIIQIDPLRVNFSMSNRDFLSMFGNERVLKEKARIRLRLADDRIYEEEGQVEFVDNRANQSTDSIQIYAAFANPDGKLIPGSTVTVLLSRQNGVRLPAVTPSAVMHDAQGAYIYIVDGENKVERRDVVLGSMSGQLQLLQAGAQPGETIVTDGMHKTMPGAVIRPDIQG